MYSINEPNYGQTAEFEMLTALPEGNGVTPKTPEIINTIMTIDQLMKRSPDGRVLSPADYTSQDTCYSSSSSNIDSPTSPTVQNLTTSLIKEELKVFVKRRNASNSESDKNSNMKSNFPVKMNQRYDDNFDTEEDDSSMNGDMSSGNQGLTPEDEERRRRRRERNKIAATKCRLKKRERTASLAQESETLQSVNQDLKIQIRALNGELNQLREMFNGHKPICIKPSPEPSPTNEIQQPPSFITSNNFLAPAIFPGNNKIADQRQPMCSDNLFWDVHQYDSDFQEVVKNPTIMLCPSENNFLDRSVLKNKCNAQFRYDKNLPRHMMASNYKNNVFNCWGEQNEPPYEFSFMDNTSNGCAV